MNLSLFCICSHLSAQPLPWSEPASSWLHWLPAVSASCLLPCWCSTLSQRGLVSCLSDHDTPMLWVPSLASCCPCSSLIPSALSRLPPVPPHLAPLSPTFPPLLPLHPSGLYFLPGTLPASDPLHMLLPEHMGLPVPHIWLSIGIFCPTTQDYFWLPVIITLGHCCLFGWLLDCLYCALIRQLPEGWGSALTVTLMIVPAPGGRAFSVLHRAWFSTIVLVYAGSLCVLTD